MRTNVIVKMTALEEMHLQAGDTVNMEVSIPSIVTQENGWYFRTTSYEGHQETQGEMLKRRLSEVSANMMGRMDAE